MSEICDKHGPYSVACRECDYEQVYGPEIDDTRSGLEIERLREIAEKAGAQPHLVPSDEWQPRYEAYADAFGPTTVLTILTRLQSLEVENARLLGEVERPSEPGGFTGDIFFGDPRNSTRGTHRWDGAQWAELPSEGETLMLLLAEARAQRDTWRKTAERMVEEPDALAAALARADAAEAALALAREGLERATGGTVALAVLDDPRLSFWGKLTPAERAGLGMAIHKHAATIAREILSTLDAAQVYASIKDAQPQEPTDV